MSMEDIIKHREFIKNNLREEMFNFISDQNKGVPAPLTEKPYPEDEELIDLIEPEKITVGNISLLEVINRRRSRRKYTENPVTLEELSFLLWSTQGVFKDRGRNNINIFRTVPSSGARHPFETYLLIFNVEGLTPGIYRYISLKHKLYFLYRDTGNLKDKIIDACYGQMFVKNAAVIFIWAAIPYRSEWRYGMVSHKSIALDGGHVCQNLYLASEAVGAGTCAICSYNQKKIDNLICVDGEDEFAVYLAPVAKVGL